MRLRVWSERGLLHAEVCFIPDQHYHHVAIGVLFQILQPLAQMFEALSTSPYFLITS